MIASLPFQIGSAVQTGQGLNLTSVLTGAMVAVGLRCLCQPAHSIVDEEIVKQLAQSYQ